MSDLNVKGLLRQVGVSVLAGLLLTSAVMAQDFVDEDFQIDPPAMPVIEADLTMVTWDAEGGEEGSDDAEDASGEITAVDVDDLAVINVAVDWEEAGDEELRGDDGVVYDDAGDGESVDPVAEETGEGCIDCNQVPDVTIMPVGEPIDSALPLDSVQDDFEVTMTGGEAVQRALSVGSEFCSGAQGGRSKQESC